MIEVRWTPQAANDLQAIHDFIARDSERYAQAEAQRIVVAIDQLVAFPSSGRVVPEDHKTAFASLCCLHTESSTVTIAMQ